MRPGRINSPSFQAFLKLKKAKRITRSSNSSTAAAPNPSIFATPTHAFLASASNFNVRVGRQHFFDQGLDLDLHAVRANGEPLAIEGHVSFIDPQPWPVRPLSPGIMGPFSFVPFMECNHGVVSLDHELRGELVINGERVPFDGGRGYIEKDWGRSFPSSYVWMQSNHFGRDGVSLTASVANIPWLWSRFTGSIIGLLVDGRLYRFATYTGARVAKLEVSDETVHLVVRDLDKVLEIEARRSHGAPLMAPYEHQMLERVSETMTSRIEVRLAKRRPGRGREIFAGVTENAALEVQGQLEEIVTS